MGELWTTGLHSAGYVIAMYIVSNYIAREQYGMRYGPISTAPAVEPAMIERKALGCVRN